jgi:hypothetical protein
MTGTKLLQVFLSQTKTPGPGIYEVSGDEQGDVYCTCPGFKVRNTCKHSRFVKSRIENNNGTYPLEISDRATAADAARAKKSDKDFREFIIKYGRIEVY